MNAKVELIEELKLLLDNVCLPRDELYQLLEQDPRFANYSVIYNNELSQMEAYIKNIRNNYQDMDDITFFKTMMTEYLTPVVEKIKSEYGAYISQEKLSKINNLPQNIEIINDNHNGHDISADSNQGKIIVNIAQIGKEQGGTLERKIAVALGSSIHETFHIVVNLLNDEHNQENRMFYELEGGQIVHFSPGKYGQVLNEGFVEKTALEFATRNNFYANINPHYASYVDLCTYITNVCPTVDTKFILNHNATQVLENFTKEAKVAYESSERLAMINSFTPKELQHSETKVNSSNVVQTWGEQEQLSKSQTKIQKTKTLVRTNPSKGYISIITIAIISVLGIFFTLIILKY